MPHEPRRPCRERWDEAAGRQVRSLEAGGGTRRERLTADLIARVAELRFAGPGAASGRLGDTGQGYPCPCPTSSSRRVTPD